MASSVESTEDAGETGCGAEFEDGFIGYEGWGVGFEVVGYYERGLPEVMALDETRVISLLWMYTVSESELSAEERCSFIDDVQMQIEWRRRRTKEKVTTSPTQSGLCPTRRREISRPLEVSYFTVVGCLSGS